MADPTLVPVYTGNDVFIQVTNGSGNPVNIALCQTLTISRMVNRRPVYQVNTAYWVDNPVTQLGVTVSVTAMTAISGGYPTLGLAPGASLTEALTLPFQTFSVVDQSGNTVANVLNAAFQQDSSEVVANDPLTYNAQWSAQDAQLR